MRHSVHVCTYVRVHTRVQQGPYFSVATQQWKFCVGHTPIRQNFFTEHFLKDQVLRGYALITIVRLRNMSSTQSHITVLKHLEIKMSILLMVTAINLQC